MAPKILIFLVVCKLATSVPDPRLNFNVKQDVNTGCRNGCSNPNTNNSPDSMINSIEDNDNPEDLTQRDETKKGEGDLNPSDAQYKWTAQQLAMKVSDGNLCRGFFICNDAQKMMKRRWRAIEVLNTIEFAGSAMTDSFFSKDFEEESTSQEFMQSVDNYGIKVSVDANANYLFVSAKAGGSVSYDKKHSKTTNTKSNEEYASSIKGYNIPTKSIDLDPMYIILNQNVLEELGKIEKNNKTENQNLLFIEFFENYGSHFLTGTIEFGGSLIVKATTSIEGSSTSDQIQDTVNKAANVYLDLSASFIEGSGSVSVKASAYSLKSSFSSNVHEDTLRSITLDFQKKGGPPGEDSIDKWKKGLVEQTDTWRIIDKSTELIAMWELIKLKHYDQFQDAKEFAGLMKEAWEYITELPSFYIESVDSQTMKELAAEFKKLGISPSSTVKRRQLVIDMVSQGNVGAQKDSKSAHLDVIPGGHVVMSVLQEKQLDSDTTMLQFDSLTFLPDRPYEVYLKLEYNNVYLGEIIIVLDGSYPSRVQQMLELSTGNNNVGGAWKGAGFDWLGSIAQPGEHMGCNGYMDENGMQQGSLFPLEEGGPGTQPVEGEVRGWRGQVSGFDIRTRSRPHAISKSLVIGHVTSGMDILQAIAARGDDFVKAVTFSDCGLVVIE